MCLQRLTKKHLPQTPSLSFSVCVCVCVCLGSSYYDNVRPLAYPDSDAVLLCFDISRPETLENVLKKVHTHTTHTHTHTHCPLFLTHYQLIPILKITLLLLVALLLARSLHTYLDLHLDLLALAATISVTNCM